MWLYHDVPVSCNPVVCIRGGVNITLFYCTSENVCYLAIVFSPSAVRGVFIFFFLMD